MPPLQFMQLLSRTMPQVCWCCTREILPSMMVMFLFFFSSLQLPVTSASSSSPCEFCPGGQISEPEKQVQLPDYYLLDSCASLDNLLPTFLTDADPTCRELRSWSTYCGCSRSSDSCSFCPDGNRVAFPEKEVPWFSNNEGQFKTCEMVESFAATLSHNDDSCLALQELSHYCGCEPIVDHCVFCPGEILQEQYYDVEMPFLDNTMLGITGNCELLYETQYQIPISDLSCLERNLVSVNCGCNEGRLPVFGISNRSQQLAVIWIPRATGMVSLIASLCIMCDILCGKKTRESVYHQLMFGIAIFDSITSIVFIVGPAVIDDTNYKYGVPWGIEGAHGNVASCRAATFFNHLGVSSVFWSVSLTVYFYMMIVKGLREEGLRRLRPWFFGPPLILGFGMAFASIPFSTAAWSTCHAKTDGIGHLWSLLVFIAIPSLLSTAIILVFQIKIYLSVRWQYQRSPCWPNAHSIGVRSTTLQASSDGGNLSPNTEGMVLSSGRLVSRQQARLEKRLFWQCLHYGVVFGVTWPFWAWAEIEGVTHGSPGRMPVAFWGFVVMILALSGFNNAICYFRYRIARRLCRKSERGFPREPPRADSRHRLSCFLARIVESSWLSNSVPESSGLDTTDGMTLGPIQEINEPTGTSNSRVVLDDRSGAGSIDDELSIRERSESGEVATIAKKSFGSPRSSSAFADSETTPKRSLEEVNTSQNSASGTMPQTSELDESEDPILQLANLSPESP